MKEEELATKVGELNRSYEASLGEMRTLLSSQRRVGVQWKEEMEVLTTRFDERLKDLKAENEELKSKLSKAENYLEEKRSELNDAVEMNGIYSAKLTRLERKFKKLKDEDEESYMEMTF